MPTQQDPAPGSASAIKTIGERTLEPGSEVVVSTPAFPYYGIVGAQLGASVVRVPVRSDFSDDLEGMRRAVSPRTRLVFVASPNNPTGQFIDEASLREFLASLPNDLVPVVDLAYVEYSKTGYAGDGVALLEAHPHVVLLRTFSKVHGLAALRVGYAVGSESTIRELERAAIPFAVSSVAQVAAQVALADSTWVETSATQNAQMRSYLATELATMGIHCVPSDANFLLFDAEHHVKNGLFAALCDDGVFVRELPDVPGHLRVTVGTADECALFVAAVRKFCSEGRHA